MIDGELAPPAVASGGNAPLGVDNLGGAVEAYLSSHFSGFPNGVPPPGLYHRILKEIEVPLLDRRAGGDARQPDPRRRPARPQPQHAAARRSATSTSRSIAAADSASRAENVSKAAGD